MKQLLTELIQIFQVSLILNLFIEIMFFLKPSAYTRVHNDELTYRRDYVWMDSRMRKAEF